MNLKRPFLAALVCLLLILCHASWAASAPLDVRTFGAAGDGKTNDTAAFQKALDACAFAGGGEVVVPAGNYLIGSIQISSFTTLRLEKDATLTGSPEKDDYPLMDVRWEGRWRQGHRALICANHARQIALVGEGAIVGDPQLAYLRDPRGPALFEPIDCENLRVEGVSFKYGRMWCMHLTYCQNVFIRNLNIRSDPSKSNGDGIDIDSCKHVLVEDCDIDAGDDAVCLKSGRGMEAVRIARPCEDVLVTDCKLGSSFAAIGFGTELSGGIRNVKIERCQLTRGSNGLFFKSRAGRGGFIEDVTAVDLEAGTGSFIGVDLTTKGIQDSEPVYGDEANTRMGNIRISNVKIHCTNLLAGSHTAPEKPLDGFYLSNVTGTCQKGVVLANATNVHLSGLNVTGFSGDLITTTNVTGSGLDSKN